MKQACADGWAAGLEAKAQLERLGQMGASSAKPAAAIGYGRSIGLCRAGGRDLGADMVSACMAWAFTRYSSDFY